VVVGRQSTPDGGHCDGYVGHRVPADVAGVMLVQPEWSSTPTLIAGGDVDGLAVWGELGVRCHTAVGGEDTAAELSSEMICRTGSLRTRMSPLGEMASTLPARKGPYA